MRKSLFWLIPLPVAMLTVALLILSGRPRYDSPLALLEKARKEIALAKSREAELYAPQLLHQAEQLYAEAMQEWRLENKRIFWFRHYERVAVIADEATRVAELSSRSSGLGVSRIKNELGIRIDTLKTQIARQEQLLSLLPLAPELKQLDAEGSLKLTEAEINFRTGNYLLASKQLHLAERSYSNLFEAVSRITNEYFKSVPHWQALVENAIRKSRKNQSVMVLVDKVAHSCSVYSKGKLLYTFPAELGANWVGDKQFQGDQATPEGEYRVEAKLSGSRTKYHRALLLNYPNEQDKKRYAENLRNGLIPEGRDIGSLLEIHGSGGKGFDWTNGCIALNDRDAEKIYGICPVGTPVIIVGSTRILEDILNNE